MAIGYWAIRGQFTITWWLPNMFLLVSPLPALARWLRTDG
jgi:hypothetical protein